MSISSRATLALALASTTLALSSAATAHAGTYYVRACHADGVNAAWVPSQTPGLVAYAECPAVGNNLGLAVRNVTHSTPATGFANARWTATAPPGTYIDELRWTGQIFRTSSWAAGIYDRANGRWLWCGGSCGTLPTWRPFQIGGFATSAIESMALCAATQCSRAGTQGGVAMKDITLRLQDTTIPNVAIVGGSLATPGWKSGVQTVEVDANDNTGIARLRSAVTNAPAAGDEQLMGCDDHRLVPCPGVARRLMRVDLRTAADGVHRLDVHAFDGSGNSWYTTRAVHVDNTPPDAPISLAANPANWQSGASFKLTWVNPPQGASAPILGARYQICREGTGPTDECRAPATVRRPQITSLDGLRLPAPGSWKVRVWLVDAAGNQNVQTSREVLVRWDPESPTVRLLPRSGDDPTRIVGLASDAVSGIAKAEVELRRENDPTWHSLPVTQTQDGFTAVIDDQRFPRGTYAIRARVTDHAGNEKSVTGSPITLPVRLVTSLAVGQLKRPKADRAGRRGRPTLVRRPEMRFGRTMRLSGRLTSPGGNALTGRDVEVSEKLSVPGSTWKPMATVRSNASGRFTFKARSGPTRLLRFRYAGTPTIRGRTTVVLLRVRAASSIRASHRRVVNGESVTFRGIVRSQPLPTTGKLLQLQVYSRGSWLTFATPRADARGRWHHPYRFTATRGLTRYRFRVRLPRESGYPYEAGVSNPVKVTVRGV